MSLVIEFCGLPGAGKSTLCQTVATRLRAAGIEVVERGLPPGRQARARRLATKAATLLAAAMLAPRSLAAVARAAWSSGLRGREWLARTVNIVVLHRRMRPVTGAVVLVDQGVIQEVVAAGLTADGPSLARQLPETCGSGVDVVVRVDVSIAVSARRLEERGTGESRLEQFEDSARADALRRAGDALDEVLERRTTGADVWQVDGAAPESAGALTDAICARIRRSDSR